MNRLDALVAAATGAAAALGASALAAPVRAEVGTAGTPAALNAPAQGPIYVAVVVGNRATVIDFAGPWEVFQDVYVPERGTSDEDRSPFRLGMVSDTLQPLSATAGMTIAAPFTFDDPKLPQPNVIVIGAQGEHTERKVAWIREAAKKADVVMSVCTGAFLLAETGLLDGLKATTHHDFYDAFAKKFPQVDLVRGPRYVENPGSNCCSAGGLTSGIELALRVVQRYFGNATLARTAYYMEYALSPERPTQA